MPDFESRSQLTGAVLVTGANGFIGSALCEHMLNQGFGVKAALRPDRRLNLSLAKVVIDAVDHRTDWADALRGIDTVIHLAGLTRSADGVAEDFRRVNVEGTLNLARQAALSGVRRFIFISSIKVNGESTTLQHAFSETDAPAPEDAYAQSKLEAERGLLALINRQCMEIVIIRPPLVYGQGVKGNFLSLMRWLDKELPLPFGAIDNKRTLVALDTLIDLVVTCIRHPEVANRVLMAGDGEDLSTTELLQKLAASIGKKARLLPVPALFLKVSLKLLGRHSLASRLFDSLRVDIGNTCKLLDWTPPLSVDEALRKTGSAYLRKQR